MLATEPTSETDHMFYVPLRFWFNRNPGLALPLIALQYHEVKINMTLAAKTDVKFTGTSVSND